MKNRKQEINNNHFIVEFYWMSLIGLKGNELRLYALIYSYSQDNKGGLHGATDYLAKRLGVPFPVMVDVKAQNSKFSNDELRNIINKVFDFAPYNIIKELKLKEQKYYPLAAYGHFGNKDYPWEEISDEVISRLMKASNS